MCVDNPYTSKEYFQYGALIKSQTAQLGEILLQEEAERERESGVFRDNDTPSGSREQFIEDVEEEEEVEEAEGKKDVISVSNCGRESSGDASIAPVPVASVHPTVTTLANQTPVKPSKVIAPVEVVTVVDQEDDSGGSDSGEEEGSSAPAIISSGLFSKSTPLKASISAGTCAASEGKIAKGQL